MLYAFHVDILHFWQGKNRYFFKYKRKKGETNLVFWLEDFPYFLQATEIFPIFGVSNREDRLRLNALHSKKLIGDFNGVKTKSLPPKKQLPVWEIRHKENTIKFKQI